MYAFGCTCIVVVCVLSRVCALKSVWKIEYDRKNWGEFFTFPSYLYKDSFVSVSILCNSAEANSHIRVNWILEEVRCMQQLYNPRTTTQSWLFHLLQLRDAKGKFDATPESEVHERKATNEQKTNFQLSRSQEFVCGDQIKLQDEANEPYSAAYLPKTNQTLKQPPSIDVESMTKRPYNSSLNLRYRVARAWNDGMYHFMIAVDFLSANDSFASADVRVEIRGEYGYLPAIDWPLLPYGGVMSVLYLCVGTAWIMVWAWAHLHTTKIHVAIGAVAVSGALSHTLMFADVSATNSNGLSVSGIGWSVILFGLIQDSIVHLLLLVVSTGYGITRYSLGRSFLVGAVCLAVASFTSGAVFSITDSERLKIKYTHHDLWIYAQYIHICILIVIAAWIMIASIATFVHLCSRRHARKTITFCVFTAICVLSFIAQIVLFCLISIQNGSLGSCTHNWKHLWLVLSAGKISNFVLLVFMMTIWRPTDKGQSYDFEPLRGTEEKDEDLKEEISEKLSLEPL